MKRKLQLFLALCTLGSIMISCSTSNDVTSNRRIQKRKYNKGFFIDFDKKWGQGGSEQVAEVEVPVASQTETAEVQPEEVFVAEENVAAIAQDQNEATTPVSTEAAAPQTTASERPVSLTNTAQQSVVAVPSEEAKETVRLRDVVRSVKQVKKQIKKTTSDDDMVILYYVLAVLIPFLAVGLVTDWDIKQVIINLLLCLLCGIPGIIHALIVVSRNV